MSSFQSQVRARVRASWNAARDASIAAMIRIHAHHIHVLRRVILAEARDVSKLLHTMIDIATEHHTELGEAEEEHEREWCVPARCHTYAASNARSRYAA